MVTMTANSEVFWSALNTEGWVAKPLAQAVADWDKVADHLSYAPAFYMRNLVNYFALYVLDTAQHVDLSAVFYWEGQAMAIWPLCLRQEQDGWVIGSNTYEVLPPLPVVGSSEVKTKSLERQCLHALVEVCRANGIARWHSVHQGSHVPLGSWYRRIMEQGASLRVTHELYLDLRPPLEEIKKTFRKSYRSLINKGLRMWQTDVITDATVGQIDEVREFHRVTAGRVTRSKATWDCQEQAIRDQRAFLVTSRDDNQRLVGAGLFAIARQEGLYFVGVYDRELFDQPIGHGIQWRAIEHMKQLGIAWYRVGDRFYLNDAHTPSEKALAIAYFQEGFASHLFVRLHADTPIPHA